MNKRVADIAASATIRTFKAMQARINTAPGQRLLSLDVMRGLIMILLAGESCLVYESLHALQTVGFPALLVMQFFHHPWHGLHFWDLVQPAFMMMAGSAMYISFYYKRQKGISWELNFKHVALRSPEVVYLWGWVALCVCR